VSNYAEVMGNYAWIIDIDLMADVAGPVGTNANAPGVSGPADAPDEFLAELAGGRGRRFRILDDDGELYYEGRWIGCNWACYDGANLDDAAFGPLWDFGAPNAGATSIWYRANGDNTGEWVEL
jgi:hypothetical protein